MEKQKKKIYVVAAIIKRDDEVFATQRGYGNYKDWWEFPGGKVETGETPEQALAREIREELAADISVDDYLKTVEYDYPEFHLSMACYWCTLKDERLTLLEHKAARCAPTAADMECALDEEELLAPIREDYKRRHRKNQGDR